jgi:FkbM family methyltransferase
LLKLIIYNKYINYYLRNISFIFKSILPNRLRIPISGSFKLKIAKGKTLKIATNPTSYITKQLFWEGADHYEFTVFFKKLLSSSEYFIDVGANFGYYSLLAAKLKDNIQIHAFEPSPGPLKYLRENIQQNGVEHVIKVYNLALSDSDEILDFYIVMNKKFPQFLNLSGEHNTGSKNLKNATQIKVESTSLDKLYDLKKIENVDLIKIDVEGAENSVIKGAEILIEQFKPKIICEILKQENANYIQQKLSGIGYEFYIFSFGELIKLNNIEISQFQKKDFIFIHPENNF